MTEQDGRPRIICIGANVESAIALSGLIEMRAEIVGVVTLPRSVAGGVSDYADLLGPCHEHGIPCIETADINSVATIGAMRRLGPDLVFVLGWSQLLGAEALGVPRQFVVGSHPSPLPRGRGRAPIPWAILTEQRRNAISLFRMVPGADAGPLLLQRWYDIPAGSDATWLYDATAQNLRDAFCDLYARLATGSVEAVGQDESMATYRARRIPPDGHIDFHQPREAVDRLVRATTRPYPGAYTYYGDAKVVVWRSDLADVPDHLGVPGQILARQGDRVLVHAADRPLWLTELAAGDGSPMAARDFVIGGTFGLRIEDELHRLRREVAELRARIGDA